MPFYNTFKRQLLRKRENAQQINYLFLKWEMFAQNKFNLFGNEFHPIPKLYFIFRNPRNILQTIISSLKEYDLHLKMKTWESRLDLKLSIKMSFVLILVLLFLIEKNFISLSLNLNCLYKISFVWLWLILNTNDFKASYFA
jgi:hypothetical protein